MKFAQCTYNQAGTTINLNLAFDNKAFIFIHPPLSPEGEDDLIRLIGDSIAAVWQKEVSTPSFFIKRIIREDQNFKLFCTDGFLIDEALILSSSQQAFAKERIKISETEQLPTRLKLSTDFLKQINDRLPEFEDEARKKMPQIDMSAAKETVKEESTSLFGRQLESDKISEILAEIGNIKKEMYEIAEMNTRTLKQLTEQIEKTNLQVLDDVMRETHSDLKQDHNKMKLQQFAKLAIGQFGGESIEASKQLLQQKMNEITPIPTQFNTEIDTITDRITKKLDMLAAIKKLVIEAIYEAASEFKQSLSPQFDAATPNNKKSMIIDFNRKFAPIATLNEKNQLSTLDQAIHSIGDTTLENLQQLISNDAKDAPGIIQKCNTSWTEESQELKIVMKHLNALNTPLTNLFKANAEFAQYANQTMTEIIRIPFPRSFQFKFTEQAMQYKTSVENECKVQKDHIVQLSKTYKRTLQIDDAREKARKAILEIQKQLATMKAPIVAFRDLLARKEQCENIMLAAKNDLDINNEAMLSVKSRQEALNSKIDPTFKLMRQKIQTFNQVLQLKSTEIDSIAKRMQSTNGQIELIIQNYKPAANETSRLTELEDKLKSLEADRLALSAQIKHVLDFKNKLAVFDQAIQLGDNITEAIAQSNVRKQQNEAKIFLLSVIKDEKRDVNTTTDLKKNMIDIYTQIDNNAVEIDKINGELSEIKKSIFTELNGKNEISPEEFQNKLSMIQDKIAAHENAKKNINEHLSALRQLSLEIGKSSA